MFPDHEKIRGLIRAALNLTSMNPQVTQAECDFYEAASKKASSSFTRTFGELVGAVDGIAALLREWEKKSAWMRSEYLSKDSVQQKEFLKSASYRGFEEEARQYHRLLVMAAWGVDHALYKPYPSENPYRNLSTFAEYRNKNRALYNRVLELKQRHEETIASAPRKISSLSIPDTLGSKMRRALTKHPYFFSIPLGAAIAPGGAYALPALGIPPAFTAITHALGILIAAAPWIFR